MYHKVYYHIIDRAEGEFQARDTNYLDALKDRDVEAFNEWLKNSSTFKMNANNIIKNHSFISYAYIRTSCVDIDVELRNARRDIEHAKKNNIKWLRELYEEEIPKLNKEYYEKDKTNWISEEYLEKYNPDILKELKGQGQGGEYKCIVGYIQTYVDNETLNDGYHAVAFCEARVRNHRIVSKLMKMYESKYRCKLGPIDIAPKTAAKFWYKKLGLTYESSLKELENKVFKVPDRKYCVNVIEHDYNSLDNYIFSLEEECPTEIPVCEADYWSY